MRMSGLTAIAIMAMSILGMSTVGATEPAECLDYGQYMQVVRHALGSARYSAASFNGDVAYLFLPTGGLQTVDLSDPDAPQLVGSLGSLPGVSSCLVAGSFLYIAVGTTGIGMYDISLPTQPRFAGVVETPGEATAMLRRGRLLLLADGSAGLQVFRLARDGTPEWVGACDTPGNAVAVDLVGDLAYVADGDGGLRIVDVSERRAPELVGGLDLPVAVTAVTHRGDCLYVGLGDQTMQAFALDGRSMPVARGQWSLDDRPRALAVRDGHLFMLADQSLSVFALADPYDPKRVGHAFFGSGCGLAFRDDLLLVPSLMRGFWLIDVAHPVSAPSAWEAEFPDFLGYAYDITIAGRHLYAARHAGGVQVYDIGDSTNVRLVETMSFPGICFETALDGAYAYVAAGGTGLRIYDVSAAPAAEPVANLDTDGWTYGVFVTPGLAHLADGDGGYQIVDIADPARPVVLSRMVTGDRIHHVEVRNGYAYLACRNAGLVVVDVRDPATPHVIAQVDTPYSCQTLELAGDFVYLPDAVEGGLQVVDVSDPAVPVVRSTVPSVAVDRLVVHGSQLYVASAFDGLCIYDVSEPGWALLTGQVSNRDPHSGYTQLCVAADGRKVYAVTTRNRQTGGSFRYTLDIEARAVQCEEAGTDLVVEFDVEPRDPRNRVPCGDRAHGLVEIALLGSAALDVADVDPRSVRFGPAGAAPIGHGHGAASRRGRDVDGDGDRDLVLGFRAADTGIRCGDREVALTGRLRAGLPFSGRAPIHTRGSGGAGVEAPDLQAMPNPLNPATTIRFTLERDERVLLAVYDVSGRRVRTLVDGDLPAGPQAFAWDGRDEAGRGAASGVYVARLRSRGGDATIRLGLLK